VMSGGHVLACGPPAEVLSGELLSSVYEHPLRVVPHPDRDIPLVLA
jgi:iron complex transport system ATP-binding protein